MENKTKETLEKQLQLLFERSQGATDIPEIVMISDAMVNIATAITSGENYLPSGKP